MGLICHRGADLPTGHSDFQKEADFATWEAGFALSYGGFLGPALPQPATAKMDRQAGKPRNIKEKRLFVMLWGRWGKQKRLFFLLLSFICNLYFICHICHKQKKIKRIIPKNLDISRKNGLEDVELRAFLRLQFCHSLLQRLCVERLVQQTDTRKKRYRAGILCGSHDCGQLRS